MTKRKKLAIISTHPIQYNAPLFAMLSASKEIQPKVFYTWSQSEKKVEDRDFQQTIEWDIPLLEGYDFEFVSNISKDPGLHHYRGLVNPELIARISKWKADGILIYGWNFQSHLKAMRYFKGRVPVYFRGDSTLLDELSGVRTMLRRGFLKWVYRHVDAAFYVGENNKAYFQSLGLKNDQLYFAPHAIDNNRFDPSINGQQIEADKMRSKLGIKTNDTVVLFAGKFESKKDPVLLVNAFNRIKHNNAHLVIAGNGPDESLIKNLAQGNDSIHFLPFQNQSKMPSVYLMSDLLALPSKGPGETWGLVVNEAMACGKAILVSNKVGSAVNLVNNDVNGRVFEAGNLESLTLNLELLIQKSNLRDMGMKSKEIISEWSFRSIQKNLEENCFKN